MNILYKLKIFLSRVFGYEKPEDEDTSIPLEERIKRLAQAKRKRLEGLAYLLGEAI